MQLNPHGIRPKVLNTFAHNSNPDPCQAYDARLFTLWGRTTI